MGLMRPGVRVRVALLLLGLAGAGGAEPPPASLSLVAVGDLLMHEDVKTSAAQDPAGFPGLWADLVPLFQSADLVFGNLESPVAPAKGRPGAPFQFNAPESLPRALRTSGFTVLSLANNHAFDQGGAGLRETLDRLGKEGLEVVGAGEDRARAEAPRILERNGFKVAFLAFTDSLNQDFNHRSAEPWVRLLDPDAAVLAVRGAHSGADLVVVSLHWGNEYQHAPSKRQRDLARALVEAGADVILGHHPHVLQPVERLEAGGHQALVAYSLGNFISNQDRTYRPDTFSVAGGDNRDGLALRLRFERRPGSNAVVLAEVGLEPLWTENNWGRVAPRREIHVVRIAAAETRVHAELDRLEKGKEGSKPDLEEKRRMTSVLERQAYLRTLLLRRKRIAEVLGDPLPQP
jgi:poly-gamma-glutamate synthesis protein (capsule biosynthesis protein)